MNETREKLHSRWLQEIARPSFLPAICAEDPQDYGKRPYRPVDSLTKEFREIIGHGRWRWANMAWEALS